MNLHPLEMFGFAGFIVAFLFMLTPQPFVAVLIALLAGFPLIYGQHLRHKALLEKWKLLERWKKDRGP